MKKMAGLVLALLAMFTITACGKKYDFTCTGEVDGEKGTIKGIVKDGKVTEIVTESITEASSEEEAKQYVALINGFGSLAEGTGTTMTAKASGKKVTMTATMDITKMDDEAKEDASFDLSDTSKDAIIKAIEAQGLTCK